MVKSNFTQKKFTGQCFGMKIYDMFVDYWLWNSSLMSVQIFEFVCGFHDRFVVLCKNLTGIMLSSDVEFMKRLVLLNESLETLCKFLLIRVPVEEVVFNVLHEACSFDQHDILVCEYI